MTVEKKIEQRNAEEESYFYEGNNIPAAWSM
jgi:hypothetical protein